MVEISGAEESELAPEIPGVWETTGCPQIIPKKLLFPHLCLALWFQLSTRAKTQKPINMTPPTPALQPQIGTQSFIMGTAVTLKLGLGSPTRPWP